MSTYHAPRPQSLRSLVALLAVLAAAIVVLLSPSAATAAPAADPPTGSCQAEAANLVANCSFETGDFSSWNVASGDTYVVGSFHDAPEDGNNQAIDGSVGGLGSISQTLSGATAGTTYQVSWWQACAESGDAQVTVSGTDDPSGTTTLLSSTDCSYGYTEFSGEFTTPGGGPLAEAPVLTFSYRNDPDYYELDNITVESTTPVVATKLVVDAPDSATSGEPFDVTVTAEDDNGTTATGYSGTVHLTSSDSAANLPDDATLTNGVGTFNVTLNTAGSQIINAADTGNPNIYGSDTVDVSASAATKLAVDAPASATAGTPFNVTVTAEDGFGNPDLTFSKAVHITSSDGAAVLPADAKLVNGVGTFSVTLNTAGSQTVTATDVDHEVTGSDTVSVSSGTVVTPTHFGVDAPATATTGDPVNVTVTAEGAGNATATGYTGTVHFSSSDAAAVLPADTTLTNGVGTFSVTFNTAGSQTVTATDTADSSITGSSDTVTVNGTGTQQATTTTVGSTPTTLTAHVAPTGPGTPTGSVTFSVNGATYGTADLDASGDATLAHTLRPGKRTIHATYSGDATFAGSSGQVVVTGPTVTTSLHSKHPATSYGWYRSNVRVTFTCTPGTGTVKCPSPTTLRTEGKKVKLHLSVVASDGGRANVRVKVKIDKTDPTVGVTGVKDGKTYTAAPTMHCAASDKLSGVASCVIHTHRHGNTVRYVAKATDKAGNKAKATGHYDLKNGTKA